MIKAPKNREEYLQRCVKLLDTKSNADFWSKRIQLADVYIYSLEDRIKELEAKLAEKEANNEHLSQD